MTTGADAVAEAVDLLRIPGIHYGADDCPHRCNPELYPHCMDCSGLTSTVLRNLGLNANCDGSFQQARNCHHGGTQMRFSEAVNTPGVFVFQGINEGQGGVPGVDHGHVGITVGDGVHTLEARGHWSGVGLFNAYSLFWDYCALAPGVARSNVPTPAPVPHPHPPELEEDLVTTIGLPRSATTPHGEKATARPWKAYNAVVLEGGARLKDDVSINGSATRHYWVPPKAAQVAGWQIIDIIDLRHDEEAPERAIAVLYAFPNKDTGTYKAYLPPLIH